MPNDSARNRCLIFFFMGLFLLGGCGSAVENPTPLGAPGTRAPFIEKEYEIHVGDALDIRFFYNPDMNQEVIVCPDGRISLPLVHEVRVVGKTPERLRSHLTKLYKVHLQDPEISVVVNSLGGHRVYVGGEVGGPGVIELTGPTTTLQAITAAGGFLETARTTEVVVLRRRNGGSAFSMALNLKDVMKGKNFSQDIVLKPYDIVLVPRSNIANVNLWVDRYIRRNIGVLSREYFYYEGAIVD